jgi:hypothetical protein
LSNIDQQLEALNLKIELKKEKTSKKGYKNLFIGTALSFTVVLSYIYKTNVLDYATLENVRIEKADVGVVFYFDVVKEGRIDFNYGDDAVLTDNFKPEDNKSFRWNWVAHGHADISIRSKNVFLTKQETERFFFNK